MSWKRPGAGLLGVAVSGALLVALYRSIDFQSVGLALLGADRLWLAISIGMIVPITILRAFRFYWVAPAGTLPGVGEALRLTLTASSLNAFMPAKAGDLIKSYRVAKGSDTSSGVAVSIIVYERLCDLFGLLSWCAVGWLIGRPDVPNVPSVLWLAIGALAAVCGVLILSRRVAAIVPRLLTSALPFRRLQKLRDLAHGWPGLLRVLKGRRRWIVAFSLVLWLTHLIQIWMFSIALSLSIPFFVSACLTGVALLAGQLPLTFAGLGTRDVALVLLLSQYATPGAAAAIGVLTVTRNILPALAGLPLVRIYLPLVVGDALRWRERTKAAGGAPGR
ncbi:MAG: lysylphosphatidylglycerol synthase transmembrane domain-containing protein [Acidobacteria bacterium]|nr:lysylphosphatidylglycerol synthase transmembrane domain-containing protein [Acidobacteriota bacterium]